MPDIWELEEIRQDLIADPPLDNTPRHYAIDPGIPDATFNKWLENVGRELKRNPFAMRRGGNISISFVQLEI